MSSLVGKTLLSQFRVESFIAAGGMGSVYRVWDIKRNAPLAMKVLHSELAEDPSMFKKFQREARALQKLAHPNIVPFYGIYESMDAVFMLERFVDGPSMKEVLKQRKGSRFPTEEMLTYMKALCSALGYAHANGVVHCDVKPGNVMMDSSGQIYLTDFGIARHTESATTTIDFAGTSAYMPPEQIRGEPVTPATDVYALGIILYEMIAGMRPFRGMSADTVASASESSPTVGVRIRQEQLNAQPPDPREINPAIPDDLAQVVLKALNKKPSHRYANAAEFFAAICAALNVSPDAVPDRVKIPEVFRKTGERVALVERGGERKPALPKSLYAIAAAGGLALIFIMLCVGAAVWSLGSTEVNPGESAQTSAESSATPRVVVQVITATNVLMPTYTATPRPAATFTPIPPPTKKVCDLEVEKKVAPDGITTLVVCWKEGVYEIPNLARGIVGIGPNKMFFVYVTSYAEVFAIRASVGKPIHLAKLKKLFHYTNVKDEPNFDLSFSGNHPYTLIVTERNMREKETVLIPRYITTPQE